MQWHPTEYLCKYFLGHNDVDHEEISADEAQAIIDRWRAKWTKEADISRWRKGIHDVHDGC
ncbi:hypothetical protein A5779_00125 [Mycolicibacterium peregrinum]|uniref:Uncharacterized protein n=1 Tax=Mycolicibacterium peregrinum TaxID=43304 RepID=A0A1A0VZC3_MYCPR|nr:hypothetical protein A5779_00125 [Mycolicibacterium peregrinum]